MRARAKRTRSMMVVRMPVWVRTCAKAATSPIQSGVEGSESGVVWILTADSVILKECPPFEKKICFFSFRRHLFLRFRQSLLFSYAISLRIPWVPRVQASPFVLRLEPFLDEERPCLLQWFRCKEEEATNYADIG